MKKKAGSDSRPPENHVEVLTAVIEAQRDVMSLGLDLAKVMELVCERSRLLTAADAGVVELIEGDEMVYRAASGAAAAFVGLRLAVSGSLSGRCVLEGKVLICEDTELDDRVDLAACRRGNARSMVVVPLRHDRQVVGVLKVFSAEPGAFGERHAEVLETMAAFISAALVNTFAREALRSSEEALRLTFEMAPIGMAMVGLDGAWLRVNAALCKSLGYTAEALSAMTFQQITHPDDLDADLALLDRLVRGEIHSYSIAKRYFRADGGVVHAELHVSLARGPNGQPVHFVSQIEDVTEQKRTEARLALADRLASAGTLAAGIAHEVNNPLTYVTTNLEFLAEHLRNFSRGPTTRRIEEMTELVSDAREGAERVRVIVRGLQTFARTDDERRESLDLVPILELSIKMVFNEIRHRARLVRDFGPIPQIHGDDRRLSQVLINLLVNAAHSIVEGNAGKNEIRVSTFTDAQGRAVVEVRDSGRGMDEKTRRRIFEPFFTTKAVGIGTGLGLAICHGIVHQHGGEIWVESTGPEGTAVRVALLPAPVSAERVSVRTAPPPSTGRRGRVLVVDDDASAARVLVRVLMRDHDVVDVRSGREALALLVADETFDVVFCDLMMPEMTGMELHEALVQRDHDVVNRIVFMTGGAFTAGAREFLDRLPTQWIEKPFDAQSVRTLVRAFVR